MGADPEPHDGILNLQAKGPPPDAYADGIRRLTLANELELQTRMPWIPPPQLVVLARKALDPG